MLMLICLILLFFVKIEPVHGNDLASRKNAKAQLLHSLIFSKLLEIYVV